MSSYIEHKGVCIMKRKLNLAVLLFALLFVLTACSQGYDFDLLGGGGTSEDVTSTDTTQTESNINQSVNTVTSDVNDDTEKQLTQFDTETVTQNSNDITADGDYYFSGEITSAIKIADTAENVHIFLEDATVTKVGKKVIDCESEGELIITLIGTNVITNYEADADEKNAIDCVGNLTVNGSGTLTVNSTKSAIKCDGTFYGLGGDLTITASSHGISACCVYLSGIEVDVISCGKDAIHAECADDVDSFDYELGFVYCDGETVLKVANCYGDGIQADTFVYIEDGTYDITTLPTWMAAESTDGCFRKSGNTYTKVASDEIRSYSGYYQLSESSKGIKVGEIDYVSNEETGDEATVASTNYSLLIAGGTLTVNSTDDGLHVNSGNLHIFGGTVEVSTCDDGVHADNNVKISGGSVTVATSYEGVEGLNVDITGGTVNVYATDDGINAANGDLSLSEQKQLCYILISGGTVYVNAYGDGVDSNGGVQISGGALFISGPTNSANGALDSESGVKITGGVVVALGASGMVETPATNSTQYSVAINTSTQTGDFILKQGDTVLYSFSQLDLWGTNKAYASIVVSCPEFTNGESYSIVTGSTTTTVTINSIVTTSGGALGPQNPWGGGFRR